MMKRIFTILIALSLTLSFAAFADGSYIKELEYKGFGIIQAELNKMCDWYNDASITLTDADGNTMDWIFIGGEEDDFYLRCADIQDGSLYRLQFSLDGSTQSVDFQCNTGCEYKLNANGVVTTHENDDDCDYCNSRNHDEDYCPNRINAGDIPEDADGLAYYFDIDRCDRCNGMGHDDDHCTNSSSHHNSSTSSHHTSSARSSSHHSSSHHGSSHHS